MIEVSSSSQLAFEYRPKHAKHFYEQGFEDGDHALKDFATGDFHRSGKLLPTKNPGVNYLVSPMNGITYWWFYNKSKCVVYVVADTPSSQDIMYLARIGLKKSLYMHSAATPKFQGKGYVSFVYSAALRRGYTIVSSTHTKDAGRLWERLAEQSNASIVYYDAINKKLYRKLSSVPKPFLKKALKLLVPMSALSSLTTTLI